MKPCHDYPAVADRFYPGSPDDLCPRRGRICFPAKPATKQKALAVVSPHAGYIYSGAVAAEVFSLVEIPETVILLGPNHHGQGGPVALSTTTWQMPMGDVPIDEEIAAQLQASLAVIKVDETAHRFEHSLEVQVPFLQAMQKNLHIVPIVVSHLSYALCVEIAESPRRGHLGIWERDPDRRLKRHEPL